MCVWENGSGEGVEGGFQVPVTGKGWLPQIPLPNCHPPSQLTLRRKGSPQHCIQAPAPTPTTHAHTYTYRQILPPCCIHTLSSLQRRGKELNLQRSPGARRCVCAETCCMTWACSLRHLPFSIYNERFRLVGFRGPSQP